VFKKKIGELGEEWEFKRDYDPVFIYVDTSKTKIFRRIPIKGGAIKSTVRDMNKAKRGFKINYVTKNSFEWLGWESKDLQGQNVNAIIPQPFKGFHENYMEVKNINGSILMHKSVRPIVCELKDGSLYPVEIGIRLAMSLDHGFQFIGVLNFLQASKNSSSEDIVLSLDKKG
jgi:PAS domain S-box-containing protein